MSLQLDIKETNRVAALITELNKFGYVLHEPADGELVWEGQTIPVHASETPSIKTYDDHRMAMAFAPAAFIRPIVIENPGVVSKSYPGFWMDLEKIQLQIN